MKEFLHEHNKSLHHYLLNILLLMFKHYLIFIFSIHTTLLFFPYNTTARDRIKTWLPGCGYPRRQCISYMHGRNHPLAIQQPDSFNVHSINYKNHLSLISLPKIFFQCAFSFNVQILISVSTVLERISKYSN
jgi:hypothetical protein